MRKSFEKRYHNESGSVLIISLLITSIVSIFLITLIHTSYNERSLSQMEIVNLQLDNIHRLAAEKFMEEMPVDQTTTYDYPHGSATITIMNIDDDIVSFWVKASIPPHLKRRRYTIKIP